MSEMCDVRTVFASLDIRLTHSQILQYEYYNHNLIIFRHHQSHSCACLRYSERALWLCMHALTTPSDTCRMCQKHTDDRLDTKPRLRSIRSRSFDECRLWNKCPKTIPSFCFLLTHAVSITVRLHCAGRLSVGLNGHWPPSPSVALLVRTTIPNMDTSKSNAKNNMPLPTYRCSTSSPAGQTVFVL